MILPSNLPDGTTHFCPSFGRYPTRAFKLKGGDEWAYWTGFDWHDLRMEPVPSIRRAMIDVRPKRTGPSNARRIEQGYLSPLPFKCTAAPVTPVWNGPEDGLPPVGTVCELRLKVAHTWSIWCRATVLFCKDNALVFQWAAEEVAHPVTLDQVQLRAVKTAEQLAAEERERVADEMVRRFAFPADNRQTVPWKGLFLQMYDCGVLKP